MSEPWMPSEEAIINAWHEASGEDCCDDPEPIRAAVERARLEAKIEELDNATCTVCQGCAEGIEYWPMDGTHRQQTSDYGDVEGGPCNCHELSDRLHGFRAALAALEGSK